MTGITVEGVTKTYRGGRVRALDGVSLAIAPGEAFGIIGPNGAGKTTLFGCLLGLLRPDGGRITVDEHAPDDVTVRAMTGYLPERLVLDRWMRGLDFLRYHHALARLPEATREDDVRAAFAQVGLDPSAEGQAVRRYSRGMLQRLGLAQALLGAPRYLFLDEPSSGVDPAGVVLFRRLLGELKRRGATIVLNSHQLEQVERVCDRVAFVRQGRVESVETLHAGAAHARVLRVRLTREAAGTLPAADRLAALAQAAGATVEGYEPPIARFVVADDAASARLLASLVQGGVGVVEATPDESRLERLFLGGAAGAPGGPDAGGGA